MTLKGDFNAETGMLERHSFRHGATAKAGNVYSVLGSDGGILANPTARGGRACGIMTVNV